MKLTRAMLLGVVGAGLAAPAMGADYQSQYMQRKWGRVPPAEQKVLDAQGASAAFRAERATVEEQFRSTYHYRRLGRFTPAQQAQVDAYRASSAYRADPIAPNVENSGSYNEKYVYRKLGRTS